MAAYGLILAGEGLSMEGAGKRRPAHCLWVRCPSAEWGRGCVPGCLLGVCPTGTWLDGSPGRQTPLKASVLLALPTPAHLATR